MGDAWRPGVIRLYALRNIMHKSPIVRFNAFATVVFTVVAVVTAVVFDDATRVVVVAVSLGLFAIGVATFLLGFFAAVQRSRTDEIAVSQLFFLAGGVAPKSVKRPMLAALATQVVVGVACAIARPSTDGKSGSVLAFGVLVPMLGLGLNGLWASKNAEFATRGSQSDGASSDDVEDAEKMENP